MLDLLYRRLGVQLNNQEAFFALVRAGLWEKDVRLACFEPFDFKEIYKLAQKQAVVGLIAAGLEHVVDKIIPQEFALTFASDALQLEQRNTAMDYFIAVMVEKMRKAGIYTLLVKGQGIAQCYERPLWRACGDVDFLLNKDNYSKSKSFLIPLASSVEEEAHRALHLGMTIDPWLVELHGTLRSCILKRMDAIIDEVQGDVFFGGNVRSWNNNQVQVFLPSFNNDVFFIFTPIIKHFFHGGIGLRQICDWCRLLWTSREALDITLLEDRIKRAGITTEWKAFAAYAVDYLGMPVEAMPMYSPDKIWSIKARRINDYVLKVGNFGHNRDTSYYSNKPYIIRKTISFCRRTADGINHFFIFPWDSICVWANVVSGGIIALFKRT